MFLSATWVLNLGGDKRDRTADLLNAIQALSQLSYTPIFDSPAFLPDFTKNYLIFNVNSRTFSWIFKFQICLILRFPLGLPTGLCALPAELYPHMKFLGNFFGMKPLIFHQTSLIIEQISKNVKWKFC